MTTAKTFEPSMGLLVAINVHEVAIKRVAKELEIEPVLLGQALDRAGYKLEPDILDISADTWRVMQNDQNYLGRFSEKKLEVVKNEPTNNATND